MKPYGGSRHEFEETASGVVDEIPSLSVVYSDKVLVKVGDPAKQIIETATNCEPLRLGDHGDPRSQQGSTI